MPARGAMLGNETVNAPQIEFSFADCLHVFVVCEALIFTRVCSLEELAKTTKRRAHEIRHGRSPGFNESVADDKKSYQPQAVWGGLTDIYQKSRNSV
jgi:chloramphenicol 3-O-phosphotransferase